VWNFLLALHKGSDGQWRITADSTTLKTAPRYSRPVTADRLIADLDEAGIKKALVLSEAFWLGGQSQGKDKTRRLQEAPDEASAVRGENDWTAAQVARYPDRLVFACAVDPLRDYAVAEVKRCAKTLNAKAVKMNLSGSGFRFDNAEQVKKLRDVFRAANEIRLAIVIHLEPGRFYGPREMEIFLDQIASAAPDTQIQIAHLAGNGPGITSPEALEAFAKARAAGDPRTKNLYFDLGGLVYKNMAPAAAEQMVRRMRQIGLDRVLYGSDSQPGVAGNPPTGEQWTWTRRQLPLTDEELKTLASNVTPYLR
jgi:predicted TIM-barrel fold metal-dependent hydrolase